VKIKAQGLINAASWIEEEFGREVLEKILQACSQKVNERCSTAIAINWHPMEEFVEFLTNAERNLGSGSGGIAERIGEAGARNNMKGALIRMAFWLSKPDFLMRRVAGLWRQFNDEGEMTILHADPGIRRFEVTGVSTPHWLFCCTITGWGRVTTEAAGIVSPTARHIQCRARGAPRCIWEVTTPGGGGPQ